VERELDFLQLLQQILTILRREAAPLRGQAIQRFVHCPAQRFFDLLIRGKERERGLQIFFILVGKRNDHALPVGDGRVQKRHQVFEDLAQISGLEHMRASSQELAIAGEGPVVIGPIVFVKAVFANHGGSLQVKEHFQR